MGSPVSVAVSGWPISRRLYAAGGLEGRHAGCAEHGRRPISFAAYDGIVNEFHQKKFRIVADEMSPHT
jgi:hypothetical protein